MTIKIIFLLSFFAIMLGIGFYYRKSTANVNGFVLGGRSVGPWLTAFAYGTSYFSAVIFIGYAGKFGWNFGLSATWIGIGNAFVGSLLAFFILGKRTRLMSHKLKSSTMSDFFGKRYHSSNIKFISSVIIFIFLIPYTASLYNGLSRLFDMAFGIPYVYCIIGMAILTAIYVIIGGYMATAANNFIQGIIMIIGIVALIVAIINGKGGFSEAITALSNIPLDHSESTGFFTSLFGPDPIGLLGVVLLTSFGVWGLPQMIQKFYSIKTESDITKGAIVSTVFAVIVAGGSYFLGGFGRLFSDVIERGEGGSVIYDSIVPIMLSGLGDILIGIVVILVLSASMSTLSSLVLTSSSTITLDFIAPLIKNKMNGKDKLSVMRIFIVFFIVISAVIAIIQVNSSVTFIADLMGISWGALAGALLGPFVYGLYWKKTTTASVYASFITGVGIMVTNLFFKDYLPALLKSPINAGVLAMAVSMVIVPIVSLISKKPDSKRVDKIFNCYKNKKNI